MDCTTELESLTGHLQLHGTQRTPHHPLEVWARSQTRCKCAVAPTTTHYPGQEPRPLVPDDGRCWPCLGLTSLGGGPLQHDWRGRGAALSSASEAGKAPMTRRQSSKRDPHQKKIHLQDGGGCGFALLLAVAACMYVAWEPVAAAASFPPLISGSTHATLAPSLSLSPSLSPGLKSALPGWCVCVSVCCECSRVPLYLSHWHQHRKQIDRQGEPGEGRSSWAVWQPIR